MFDRVFYTKLKSISASHLKRKIYSCGVFLAAANLDGGSLERIKSQQRLISGTATLIGLLMKSLLLESNEQVDHFS